MKKIVIIINLYFITSCTNENIKIPENAIIVAKYIVHDEEQSPNFSNCSDLKNDFLKANKSECSFTMDDYEFDIEDKYIFNKKGEFVEFWNYLSEGAVVSKIEDLKKDPNYLTSIGGENIKVKWGGGKKTIITEKDILKIEKIFPKYKLIWIERENEIKKTGRRILIEYR
jgi:hypothetical protein